MKNGTQSPSQLLKSPFYGLATWVVPLLLSAIATPTIIHALGTVEYGFYVLALSFVVNLNVSRALTKEISTDIGSKDWDSISSSISAALVLNVVVGLTFAVLLWGASKVILVDLLAVSSASREQLLASFYLVAGILFLNQFTQFVYAILMGIHRFDLFSKLFVANAFIQISGNVVLAYLGFDYRTLLEWYIASQLLILLVGFLILYMLLKDVRLRLSFRNPKFRKILSFSAGTILFQIMMTGLIQFERGWLMRYNGPDEVAYYVVPFTLGMYVQHFVASLLVVTFPLSSAFAKDIPKLRALYLNATRAAIFVVFFIMVTVFVNAQDFLLIWIGPEFASRSWLLLVAHTLSFSILAIQIVSWQLMEGLGRIFYNSAVYTLAVCVVLGLIIFVPGQTGGEAVAWARVAGFGSLSVSIFIVEALVFGRIQVRFWVKNGWAFGVAAIISGAAEIGSSYGFSLGWIGLFVSTALGLGVYLICAYLLGGITKQDFALLKAVATRAKPSEEVVI